MSTDLLLLRRYHETADALAFRELVHTHAGMVFATARRIVRDAALAEDVAQETFLELARHAGAIDESVGAWLHRVAWRRACNLVRDAATRQRYETAALSEESGSATDASWRELEPLVDAALQELPPRLRGPVVAHFLEQRTQQQVATEIGVSQSSVSRLLDEGIEALRLRLRRKGLSVGAGLAVLLLAHAGGSAPATLLASLGKVALSGVSAPRDGAGSFLGAIRVPRLALALATVAVVATLHGWSAAALARRAQPLATATAPATTITPVSPNLPGPAPANAWAPPGAAANAAAPAWTPAAPARSARELPEVILSEPKSKSAPRP
jgi:RNA polymerase sigma factor (sigma-70 family)